jgi:hypothetical protein
MSRLDEFERLANAATGEDVPPLDVTAEVMRRLTAEPSETLWVFAVFGTVSAAAAAAAVCLVAWSWSAWTDPFNQFFAHITLVMQ